VGLALVMTLFVAASGAFGTGRVSPELRYPILIGLGLVLSLAGIGLGRVLGGVAALKSRPAARLAATALAGFSIATLACWGLALAFEGPRTPPISSFLIPIATYLALAIALEGLMRLGPGVARRLGPARPAILQRLPHRLRGAAIIAVQGEDHYVRVHTSEGEHLVWMRLRDALDELAPLEGGQTHRSWWVAKGAVRGVRRGNGRAVLTLAGGVEAPVSRSFAPALRADGWY